MAAEEIISFLTSLFGGGIVVAVGNWVFSMKAAYKQREVDYIKNGSSGECVPLTKRA
jgi:hypothetical protein